MALILRYFTEFGRFRSAQSKSWLKMSSLKSSRSLSHLLMSFWLSYTVIGSVRRGFLRTQDPPLYYYYSIISYCS